MLNMIGNRPTVLFQVLSLEELLACCTRSHLQSLAPLDDQHYAAMLEQLLDSARLRKNSKVVLLYTEETILDSPRDLLRNSRQLTSLALLVCHEPGSLFTKRFVDYAMRKLILPSPSNDPDQELYDPDDETGRRYWLIAWVVAVLCCTNDQMASQFGNAGIIDLVRAQLSLIDCQHILGLEQLGHTLGFVSVCPCLSNDSTTVWAPPFPHLVILFRHHQRPPYLSCANVAGPKAHVVPRAHNFDVLVRVQVVVTNTSNSERDLTYISQVKPGRRTSGIRTTHTTLT